MKKLVSDVFTNSLWIDKDFKPPIEGLKHARSIQDAVNTIECTDDKSKMNIFISMKNFEDVLDIVNFIKNRDSELLKKTFVVYNGNKELSNMFLLPCTCAYYAEVKA